MAFSGTNDFITGRAPVPFPAGLEVISQRFTLALTTGDLALNTIGQIGILPAGCIPVDVHIDCDDVDSGAGAGVYQVGIWDGSGANLSVLTADGGGAWGDTGAAVAVAFDKPITKLLNNMKKVASSGVDRKIGVKVTTAPTTAVAGTIGVTVFYRAN